MSIYQRKILFFIALSEKKIYNNIADITELKEKRKMTYTQAVEKINSLLVFGSRPGLERIREMVDRMGAPDRSLKFVHIAGTNGKGSTCAMIASALKEAGYKTGLFISPYVLEFRERFSIKQLLREHDHL